MPDIDNLFRIQQSDLNGTRQRDLPSKLKKMVLGLSKKIYDFNCMERTIPITFKEGSYCFIALCIGHSAECLSHAIRNENQ